MSRRLLIETDPRQTRVALIEDGRLSELHVEPVTGGGHVGEVYKARISRVVPAIDAAFVDLGLDRDAFLFVDDAQSAGGEEIEAGAPPRPIRELVRKGQEVVVQVVKDPLPGKGARVSTQITLPGRFVVLLPGSEGVGAVSRRIRDEEERGRLQALAAELAPEGDGMIVRTVAEGVSAVALAEDLAELAALWRAITRRAAEVSAPARLHRDLPPVVRWVRERFDEDVAELWVDGEESWNEVREFVELRLPELADRLHREPQTARLFERFDVERQIAAALEARVDLPAGGHLIIQPTEALVAIDVNSGSSLSGDDLEATALMTNLEAAREVSRQLRLRDLSGIIVVDFIDMVNREYREQLLERLREELEGDPVPSQITPISAFGLVEITRRRNRTAFRRSLTRLCPECGGSGRVRSLGEATSALWRAAWRTARAAACRQLRIEVHPELLEHLEAHERPLVEELRRRLPCELELARGAELPRGSFRIDRGGPGP
ncbi:MAG: Rne/Rng family ribonuclease [Thermoanaerobaculia bacterium]